MTSKPERKYDEDGRVSDPLRIVSRPFDYEAAITGAKFTTARGIPVHIYDWELKHGKYRMVGKYRSDQGGNGQGNAEIVAHWTVNGEPNDAANLAAYLVMPAAKRSGWVAIAKSPRDCRRAGLVYDTLEEAKADKVKAGGEEYLQIVGYAKIEWEE